MGHTLPRVGRRLTAAGERDITERIWAAEAEARRALQGVPEAMAVLGRGAANRRWQTRIVEVDLLEEAIETCEATARPRAAQAAAQARAAWDRAQSLRWELALSASHVVPHEARRIANAMSIDETDLIHEGFLGLLRAAARFDPSRGVRFRTYGRWWARAQMTRAVEAGGRAVRLTGVAAEQLRTLRRAQGAREAQGKPARVADLAADTGIAEERVLELLASPRVVSLESALSEDEPEGRRLGDRIAGDGEDAEQIAASQDLLDQLRGAVASLPDARARYVLTRHYGLLDDEPSTLAAIGRELGLSRERVRQIEAAALRWLRDESGLMGLPEDERLLAG